MKEQFFNMAGWSKELYTAAEDQKYTGKQLNTQP